MKQTTDTCNNMDESHYTTRKKYYTKEFTVLLHFCEVLKQVKFINEGKESKEWLPLWDGAGNDRKGL